MTFNSKLFQKECSWTWSVTYAWEITPLKLPLHLRGVKELKQYLLSHNPRLPPSDVFTVVVQEIYRQIFKISGTNPKT